MSVNIKVTGGLNIEWGQIDPKVTGGLTLTGERSRRSNTRVSWVASVGLRTRQQQISKTTIK